MWLYAAGGVGQQAGVGAGKEEAGRPNAWRESHCPLDAGAVWCLIELSLSLGSACDMIILLSHIQ